MRRRWVGLGFSAAVLFGALVTAKPPERAVNRSLQRQTAAVWSEPIVVASGPAYQGAWRQNDSQFHYVDDPTVAVANTGLIPVAWADQTRRDIFFQAYDRGGEPLLDVPVNVSRSPEVFSWLPRIALPRTDPNLVYMAWQELIFSGGSHGGDIFFVRSTDGGRSFGAPLNLSESSAGDGKGRVSPERWDNGSLDVAAGPAGEIHVAWTEYEGALWHRRSTDAGRNFTERMRIAGDGTAPARAPSLAVDGGRNVHLAWAVREGELPGIRVASSTDGGVGFGAPVLVGARDGRDDAPKIAVDGEGTVHLAYAEESVQRSRVLYTRRLGGAESFAPPLTISSTDRAGSGGYPSLAIDGQEGVYVVWERLLTIAGPLGLGFAHSQDAGHTFSAPSLVPGTGDFWLGINGSRQGLLTKKLAVAGNGIVAVVNSSFAEGAVSRVRLILGAIRSVTSTPPVVVHD